MYAPRRPERVIDSHSKKEANVDFRGIHDKGMHSPPRQKMEGFLLNLSPPSEKNNFTFEIKQQKRSSRFICFSPTK